MQRAAMVLAWQTGVIKETLENAAALGHKRDIAMKLAGGKTSNGGYLLCLDWVSLSLNKSAAVELDFAFLGGIGFEEDYGAHESAVTHVFI